MPAERLRAVLRTYVVGGGLLLVAVSGFELATFWLLEYTLPSTSLFQPLLFPWGVAITEFGLAIPGTARFPSVPELPLEADERRAVLLGSATASVLYVVAIVVRIVPGSVEYYSFAFGAVLFLGSVLTILCAGLLGKATFDLIEWGGESAQ